MKQRKCFHCLLLEDASEALAMGDEYAHRALTDLAAREKHWDGEEEAIDIADGVVVPASDVGYDDRSGRSTYVLVAVGLLLVLASALQWVLR